MIIAKMAKYRPMSQVDTTLTLEPNKFYFSRKSKPKHEIFM